MNENEDRPRTPETTLVTVAGATFELAETVRRLLMRVERLEAIERRLNYPNIILLLGILVTLVYIAHALPSSFH